MGLASRAVPSWSELRAVAEGRAATIEATWLPAGVGCIAIRTFDSGAARKVFNALSDLEARGMRSLVIDLRGNRGGDAAAALALADDCLPGGRIMVETVDADGDVDPIASRGPARWTFPLAILVDAETASAAELFAGILQREQRAEIVGENTCGKASAQQVVPQTDGQPLYATVLRYRWPDGASWEGEGLVPDVLVRHGDAMRHAWHRLAPIASYPDG